ncbi:MULTISPECIES: toxin-antitoxin system TumE family protein [Cyanophyceae]|uniref:Uncharacterized protein n=1 Tax=Nodularia spumigena CENA596 TaxID=1819295 RepID=A0A166KMP4_NODSP|nr:MULTISPECIES: DUF6516 family protein [Cyanophyceae]MDB9355439.1 DUF6516 family protein [Nodularia spumigena CS-587/03]KZL51316.1 hypothetical protein A2T98_02895 [Nodularia spumigena CENA596]MDB9302923.1 DUF6516 family protein [Nodularia spumigena CS-591/12]MDB9340414.1 DUF6516 family protein [Nodularia spumigena CS-589/07]MDB9343837.1 DUF6516 family protein [Nodularia spumigena CS-588/06]
MISQQYITEVKTKLNNNKLIIKIEIIKERAIPDQGYFRARLTLNNGDFLEVAEFFKVENEQCLTITYRYQWMNPSQTQLKKRWDNVEHFPNLPNFPHHVHVGDELIVKPSESKNILQILTLIQEEIQNA